MGNSLARKYNKKALGLLITIFLLIVLATLFFIFKNDVLRFFKADVIAKDAGEVKKIAISTGSQVFAENGFIYIFEDTGVSIYKGKGEFQRSYLLPYNDLQMTASSFGLIAYDKGTKNFTLFREGKKVNDFEAKTPIIHLLAFEKSIMILAKGEKGYAGAVYLISDLGNVLTEDNYKNNIQYVSKYPVYGDVSASGKNFLVLCLDLEDMDKTYTELFEVGKSAPIAATVFDEFLPKGLLFNNNVFAMAGSDGIVFVDQSMEKNRVLSHVLVDYIQKIDKDLFVYSKDEKDNYIICINGEGQEEWKKKVESDLGGMITFENKVLTWKNREINIYKNKGAFFHTIETDSNIQNIIFLGNNRLLIVTSDNIVIYKY